MFTAENFRRILDAENRKGIDLVQRYFGHLHHMTDAVRIKVAELRHWRKIKSTMSTTAFQPKEDSLKDELAKLKSVKSDAIDAELEKLSQIVSIPTFRIDLTQKTGPKAKPVYCIDGTPETFFVVKQLQSNIFRIYKVKQSNRHELACRIRDTIGTGFPFELVKTDISDFYESVDQNKLYAKLDQDQLLSSSSKRFIRQILTSYRVLSGNVKGIPRGVGISAYLAELFLRPVDKEIGKLPGIVLFCRYVDDIVSVFARPPTGLPVGNYKDIILEILKNNGLTHNASKTLELSLAGGPHNFEYLGYRFEVNFNTLTIVPSDAKIAKLQKRLEAAFSQYHRDVPTQQRRAYRELIARVKFLTGNARLQNSKSSATTGIYYNSPLVNDTKPYEKLDSLLKKKIAALKRPKLRSSLKKYGFTSGFLEKRFHNFSFRELQSVVRAWSHVEA
jgi:hypothetical protein